MDKFISIIVPIRNEEKYIKECIESIISFEYPSHLLEILFVDGMSDDNTISIINQYIEKYDFIKIINNNDKIVPIAMNIGIKASRGDYICRLDAHARYPKNYICKLLEWSQKLNADNVGSVCITGTKNNTNKSNAIQFVMSDKFGVGNSLFRTGVDSPMEVDTVPFGFYKADVFKRIGLYDERLVRVQDLELNKRLKKAGGRIYLIPEVECIYYPRETYKSFFKNRFDTGKWVILTLYFTNSLKSISIRHMIPFLFTTTIASSFILGFFNSIFFNLCSFILILYFGVLFFRALKIQKKITLSLHTILAYFILHFSYGLGSIKAFSSIIIDSWRNK